MAAAALPDVTPEIAKGLEGVEQEPQNGDAIPVELYLHTSYRPEMEYVDGRLLERNLGEIPHARLQGFFAWLIRSREAEWQARALPAQRVQVKAKRYRVPDVSVVPLRIADKRIVRTAPLLCIEILSAEDRMGEMQERVDDYLQMGVRAVWVIDPRRRKIFSADAEGKLSPVTDKLTLAGTSVEVPVADVSPSWIAMNECG